MKVHKIHKNRRSSQDRRQSNVPYNGPERRSGKDRRKLEKRLKEMIAQDEKEKAAKKQIIKKSGNGKVIRRRKGEQDKKLTE